MIAPILFAINAHKEVVWETCVQWSCYRTGLGKEAPVGYLMEMKTRKWKHRGAMSKLSNIGAELTLDTEPLWLLIQASSVAL